MQADTAEEADGAVLSEDVPPHDLEEGPRRELEALCRRATFLRATDHPQAPFDAPSVPDGRRGRFLDGHQEVAACFVTVGELGDPRAPEQAQGRQPALALVDGVKTERLSLFDLELTFDRSSAGPYVA